MPEKINCAVIGVGNIGRHHARNYSEITGVKLVAVCDINPAAGKKIAEEYGCRFYENYKEMLVKEKIDIVSVATPIGMHFTIARNCIRAGKNVLIEKPVALTPAEAEKMINESKKANIKSTVGHVERFNPAVRKLKEIIKEGKLGEIKSLIFQRVGPVPSADKSVNIVLDMGIHDIDLANFILGTKPEKVIAFGGKARNTGREDFADILLKYGKTNVHLQTNWITPIKIRRLMAVGTKGYLELDFINESLDFFREGSKKIPVRIIKKEPLREELQSFITDVRSGRRPLVGLEDGLAALEIAVKINEKIKYQNSPER